MHPIHNCRIAGISIFKQFVLVFADEEYYGFFQVIAVFHDGRMVVIRQLFFAVVFEEMPVVPAMAIVQMVTCALSDIRKIDGHFNGENRSAGFFVDK